MVKLVRESAAGKAIAAWVITNGRGEYVAKVQAHFAPSGGVSVDVFDSERGVVQHGRAGGYGYDKLTAALRGLVIAGHTLADHCEVRLSPPRGLPGFPPDYRRKGYQTANYMQWVRDNADSPWRALSEIERSAVRPRSHGALGDSPDELAARDFVRAAMGRDDVFSGFSDCYQVAGLEYLTERGLRVHQAI
jgi:hypothetical protein